MKGKIIALLTATLCVGTMFTACGGDDSLCASGHIDGDKDHLCDNCKSAVVLVTEKLPAEEELKVDMVVNALPTEDKNADYVNTTFEGVDAIKGEVKKEKYGVSKGRTLVDEPVVEGTKTTSIYETVSVNSVRANIKAVRITKETVVVDTANSENDSHTFNIDYILYDVVQDKELFKKSVTCKDAADWATAQYKFEVYGKNMYKVTTASIEFENTTDYDDIKKIVITEDLYDMAGNLLVTEKHDPIYSFTSFVPKINPVPGSLNNGETTWKVDGVTYVFDGETNKLVFKTEKDQLLFDRPEFDQVVGDKGYVYENSRLYVFNLKSTEWVDCIYTYDVASYNSDVKVFYMDNGNVLIQSKVDSVSSVNYDIVESEVKKDLVYTMIDFSGETVAVKEVEFGYYINYMAVTSEDNMPTLKAGLNLANVNPIVDYKINTNETIIVAVDKDLNIVWDYDKTLLGQTNAAPELVADGLFKVRVAYDNVTTRTAVVDTEGKFLNWIPMNAIEENGFLKIGGSLYSYKLDLVIDAEDYTIVDKGDYYMLYEEVYKEVPEGSEDLPEYLGTNVYYFSSAVSAPVKVVDYTKNTTTTAEVEGKTIETTTAYSLDASTSDYFTIKCVVNVKVNGVLSAKDSSVAYDVYNAAGEKLVSVDNAVSSITPNADFVVIALENGDKYIVRPVAE